MNVLFRSAVERPMVTSMRGTMTALARGATAVALVAVLVVTAAGGAAAEQQTYQVMPGDTITGISAQFDVSPSALVAANNIVNPDDILIGARLVIPSATTDSDDNPGTYTVQPGDTLTAIASQFGVSLSSLVAANDLTDPDLVDIGTQLVIPGAGESDDISSGSGSGEAAQAGPLAPVYAPRRGSPRFPDGLLAYPDRLALRPVFEHWARVYGVPAGLLEALAWMESGWQSDVVSSTGAVGVGQLEPSTVRFVSIGLLGLAQPLDARVPQENIEMSAAYLAWIIRAANGSVADALGGYYQGLGSLYADGPFPSTRNYALVIGELWHQFRSG